MIHVGHQRSDREQQTTRNLAFVGQFVRSSFVGHSKLLFQRLAYIRAMEDWKLGRIPPKRRGLVRCPRSPADKLNVAGVP
jgi:hypothetical protein